MTTTTHTTPVAPTLADRFAMLAGELGERLHRRRLYRTTLRELSALDDRQLADLGLNRSIIKRVAHQAAYDG